MLVRDPERLRAAIVESRLTYRQLGVLVGVDRSFFGQLIPARDAPPGTKPRRRSCRNETAIRIARELDRPVDELFSNRRASDPSTGELAVQNPENSAPVTTPIRMPAVSTSSTQGRHRRRDQT